MRKKIKAKFSADAARNTSQASEQQQRLQWWQLLLGGVLVPVLLGIFQLIPKLNDFFKGSPPKFEIKNPIIKDDFNIFITATNPPANRPLPLNVEFKELLFPESGQIIAHESPLCWRFTPKELDLPDSMLHDGKHWLRVGFRGEALSDPIPVFFRTQPPLVSVKIEQPVGHSRSRIMNGRAVSALQTPAETLSVEIVFYQKNRIQRIPIPTKPVILKNQFTYYEFRMKVQDVPEISSRDPRYHEPFWAISVNGQLGKPFEHEESYAQFAESQPRYVGVNNLDEFKTLPVSTEFIEPLRTAFRPTSTFVTFPSFPNGKQENNKNFEKNMSITLEVSTPAQKPESFQLKWQNRLSDNLRSEKVITVVFRNDELIVMTFRSFYQDDEAPIEEESRYRVEQIGYDGQVYLSNVCKVARKRSNMKNDSSFAKPFEEIVSNDTNALEVLVIASHARQETTAVLPIDSSHYTTPDVIIHYLREDGVKNLLATNSFFHSLWNMSGKGIDNQYSIKNSTIVQDNATGLIWQQSGSSTGVTYWGAKKYIQELNDQNFGGYTDWRLPTLKEAMSLMESKKKNGDLYIDGVFEQKQFWLWTKDMISSNRAWTVNLGVGICYHDDLSDLHYVRAVRSQ